MNERDAHSPMPDPARCPQCGTPVTPGALGGLCPACLLKQGVTPDTATQPPAPPFEPPPIAEIAKLFPQLEILALLGKGGMGAVYQARQPALDRLVALKILPAQATPDAGFAERFTREARALARLNHPHIVAVYEYGQAGGLNYFLMEFVDGVNLRQLQRSGRLSPREALQIVPQICDALQYAHDEGVVHRDIKPENVLVDRRGRVKIADFGLAKILGRGGPEPHLTREGQVMGTPHYMAPEQVERPADVDHRADIFSLGVVFYEMLTGELPLGKFPPPSRRVQVDVRLDDVVLHALEKEPDRRYQHAGEVKTAVETIVSSPASATPSPASAWAALWKRRKAIVFSVVSFCFVVAAGIALNGMLAYAVPDVTSAWIGFFNLVGAAGFAAAAYKHSRASQSSPSAASRFARAARIGLAVLGLTFLIAAGITAFMPRSYAACARVDVESARQPRFDPYRFEIALAEIRSDGVLESVISRLGLQERWAARMGDGEPLHRNEALVLLRDSLSVRQSRGTSLLEVRVAWRTPMEAAELANAIVDAYQDSQPSGTVEIINRAQPPPFAIRPNVPLNLAVGALAGITLGFVAGLTAFLAFAPPPAATGKSPPPANVHFHAHCALGLFLAGTLGTLLLMTLSPRHELALTFGGLALVLALVFGFIGRRQRLARGVVVATLLLIVGAGLAMAFVAGWWRLGFQRSAAQQLEEQLRDRALAAAQARAQVAAKDATPNPATAADPGALPAPESASPPVVVKTFPEAGASNVPPDLDQIVITFSKPMLPGNWSWGVVGEDKSLQQVGVSQYLDAHTWALKVPLEPGRVYGFWLNGNGADGFQDTSGVPALPYLLVFKTRK